MRFSFGVAIREDSVGNEEDVRLEPFDYTNKNVITIKKENAAIATKIQRVKALNCNSKMWIFNPDAADKLYMNEPVTNVKGVSATKVVLLEQNGLHTVNDLVNLGSNARAFKSIWKNTKGLDEKGLRSFIDK